MTPIDLQPAPSAAQREADLLLSELNDCAYTSSLGSERALVEAHVSDPDAFVGDTPVTQAIATIRAAIDAYGVGTSLPAIAAGTTALQAMRHPVVPTNPVRIFRESPRTDPKPDPCPDPARCRFGWAEEVPDSLDPALVNSVYDVHVLFNIFENLLMAGVTEGYTFGAAKEFRVSDGGRKYTFTLREQQWSNGRRVTAEDFVFAWTRVLDTRLKAPTAERLFVVKNAKAYYEDQRVPLGLRAIDAQTFEVTLENPTPFFPYMITDPVFAPVPREVVERHGQDWARPAHIVTNGAYVPSSAKYRQELRLTPNHHYWDKDHVQITNVRIRHIEDENTILQWYELRDAGADVDWVPSIPPSHVEQYQDRPGFRTLRTVANEMIALNVSQPPFKDPSLRRALAFAIDRRSLMRVAPIGTPARLHIPEIFKDFPVFASIYKYLGDEMIVHSRLLAQEYFSAHPNLEAEYLFDGKTRHRTTAEFLQRQLSEQGFTLVPSSLERGTKWARGHAGEYQFMRWGWTADYPDPLNFLEYYTTGNENNDFRYANPAFDALYASALIATDQEIRNQTIAKMLRILLRDMPAVPLFDYAFPMLINPDLKACPFTFAGSPVIKDVRR